MYYCFPFNTLMSLTVVTFNGDFLVVFISSGGEYSFKVLVILGSRGGIGLSINGADSRGRKYLD